MKEYTKKTLNKLTELLTLYPNADVRFSNNLLVVTGCKVLESDIKYNSETNTIYIG